MRRPPFAEDVTAYREQLRQWGAFPQREGIGWTFEPGRLMDLVKGYYERSALHRYEGVKSDLEGGCSLTNEHDHLSLIEGSDGGGGAYIGSDRIFSYTTAAWQGSAHAYSIHVNELIPMVAVPLYGVLLAVSANRFEFLSTLCGKPIPKTDEWAGFIEGPADVLAGRIKALPRDFAFEASIDNVVKMVMRACRTFCEKGGIADSVVGCLKSFRDAIDSDWSDVHPIAILTARDANGRGGALSGERQLARERDIFIDNRITGVASPLDGRGIAAIAADMAERRIELGGLNVSNAERDVVLRALKEAGVAAGDR